MERDLTRPRVPAPSAVERDLDQIHGAEKVLTAPSAGPRQPALRGRPVIGTNQPQNQAICTSRSCRDPLRSIRSMLGVWRRLARSIGIRLRWSLVGPGLSGFSSRKVRPILVVTDLFIWRGIDDQRSRSLVMDVGPRWEHGGSSDEMRAMDRGDCPPTAVYPVPQSRTLTSKDRFPRMRPSPDVGGLDHGVSGQVP